MLSVADRLNTNTARLISAAINTTKATAPTMDRVGNVRGTLSQFTHQRQTNQLGASITGVSSTTAGISPRRGASNRTRTVPKMKPIRKTTRAQGAAAAVAMPIGSTSARFG